MYPVVRVHTKEQTSATEDGKEEDTVIKEMNCNTNKAYNIPAPPAAHPHHLLPPASGLGPLPSPAPLASIPQTIILNITALHEGGGGSQKKNRVFGMPFGVSTFILGWASVDSFVEYL